MDVKDYSVKADQVRTRYREAAEDLRESYDKNVDDIKSTYEHKTEKQSKNFRSQNLKLEEQNLVNNDLYSNKAKDVVEKNQNDFKDRLKDNVSKFEQERNSSKLEFKDKLSNLSESFKKSTEESNQLNDQTKRIMGERYSAANKRYKEDFSDQVTRLEDKSKSQNIENRNQSKVDRLVLAKNHSDNLESLRVSNEKNFKEVSGQRGDMENLRTSFDRERGMLADQQDERVSRLVKTKAKESQESHNKFEVLQNDLRQKNLGDQERQSLLHKKESKDLSEKFNNDFRNIQSVTAQTVKGGTHTDSLSEELKQSKFSYENRLEKSRNDLNQTEVANTVKEESINKNYRETLKEMKSSSVQVGEKKEQAANENLKKSVYELKDKNNALIDRYKSDGLQRKYEGEEKISSLNEKSDSRIKQQRVEFGKVVNTMNEKNMDTISSLKDDFSKDKSTAIERSKKESNDDKISLKTDFNRQMLLKETIYEQRLSEIEKKTGKIIENYENRISQISRKTDKEIDLIKKTESERKMQEEQALKISLANMQQSHRSEIGQQRERFDHIVSKDRVLNDQKLNRIVQKYEDQLERERTEGQKTMAVRLGESQQQLERLFVSSEQEKIDIRAQSESKIENMKLASIAQENSKKV